MIDINEAESEVIATEWTIIEEQDQEGAKKIKARLCLVGNMKESLHKICKQIPTVSNKTLKILLSIAVSQGWEIRTCDVEKAFLQSDEMQHGILVEPPAELNLQKGKVLKLNNTAFGMIDASRAFYLKQVEELKDDNFLPLKVDPAMFIHSLARQTL